MRSVVLGGACFLLALQQSILSAAADTQVKTNGQLLALCRTESDECRKEAERHGKATALALEILEVQTGQCITDFPETISGETLADVGLSYIRYKGAGADEDLSLSFMRAFTEEFPCRKQ
ncbi:MAG TPA: hypothetical protein VJV39_12080 [Dongiaceae bacterium]|nr:hypothetical protein [Dongiaceae bacterium]